jgi:hypothetical protein
MIDRRSVCTGTAAALAGTLAGGVAHAAQDKPLFVSGPMSRNFLATFFKTPGDPLILPDTPLVSAHGPQRLSQLGGRTWLVSLWAEWCAPCLQEATDLAMIGRTHGGPSFGVIFVLTHSDKKLALAQAQAVMAKRGAGDATLFVEADGKDKVYQALATQDYPDWQRAIAKSDRGASLPCNLLVDRHGQVRARSFGAPAASNGPPLHEGPMTDADKERALKMHTMWATPTGAEFAAALAAGVLDKA